jgi:tRNA(Ile)-lysidine synthase TilS/MesJ
MIHAIAQKFEMETNGYASFHGKNFAVNHHLPCYIPENATNSNDIFSRNDIRLQVKEWLSREDTMEYLLESYEGVMPLITEEFINNWVVNVYENITWEFPSTYLENLLM